MADEADRSDPDPALKPDDSGADDSTVPASPRPASPMSWEPVTAGGDAPAGSGEPGGFSFNLDEAVARIDASGQIPRPEERDLPAEPAAAPVADPVSDDTTDDLVSWADDPVLAEPVAPSAPIETPAASVDSPPEPVVPEPVLPAAAAVDASLAPVVPAAAAVDAPPAPVVPAAAPTLPPVVPAAPANQPVLEPVGAAVLAGSGTSIVPSTAPDTQVPSPTPVAAEPALPSLPPVMPVVTTPVQTAAPPAAAPIPPTTRATSSSAAARKRKKKKQGGGGKVFIVLLLIGGLVAAGWIWGRPYLFPDRWDEELAPIADRIEEATGLEFDDAVEYDVLPAAEHGAVVLQSHFGGDWVASVPLWRALGLVAGDVDESTLSDAVADPVPAQYDPVTGVLTRSDGVVGVTRSTALAVELATALFVQEARAAAGEPAPTEESDSGDAVVSAAPTIPAGRSIAERAVVRSEAAELAGTVPALDPASLTGFPALLAYDLLAVDRLGGPLVATLGEAAAGQLPHQIVTALDPALLEAVEPPVAAAAAPSLADGDSITGDATSWGRDLWYLALGAYLAPDQAGPASDAIAADLLTPVSRGDVTCAYATFTPVAGAESVLELYLAQWTLNAPASAGATSQRLPDGTLQLVACDPGPGATTLPRTGVATELVDRVAARIPAS